jgi:phenylacetate-CoA ligase
MKKPKDGIFKAWLQCLKHQKLNKSERNALQDKRLRHIVTWARENSPYYSNHYQDIGADFKLTDLPPVNKVELMAHWDEWLTDRSITLSQVNDFICNLDNIGRKMKGKYLVFTTSGSTGNPLVALCDKTTNNIMAAINMSRTFAHKENMTTFIKRGGKSIGVFATGGFYLGNSSVRARLLAMPWKKRQIAVTSALLPIAKIVRQLNAFQPAMLGGYPSNLELLIDEQKRGNLHINPVLIMTGGEYLSDFLRSELAQTFNCNVQTSYSCTEGGTIACECAEQHFHINDDWVIVEPVDINNNPVPNGVRSDKILLTNLFNYTQPFIRYEITDRVTLHDEPCPCGNPSPWLTLEGRNDDVISFTQNNCEIKLAPLAIYATLKEVHELRRFQLIAQQAKNLAQLRLVPIENVTKEDAFQKAKAVLETFFSLHGLQDISIILSDEEPKQDTGSGKFKHIIRVI